MQIEEYPVKVPDLDRLPRAGQPHQHGEQLALVLGDLHAGTAAQLAVGLFGEVAEHVVRRLGMGEEVVVDGGADDVHAAQSGGYRVNSPTWPPFASYQSTYRPLARGAATSCV